MDVSAKSKKVIVTKSFGILVFTGILLTCALLAVAKTFWQGFLLAGIGVLAMLCHKQTKNSAFVVVPPVFSGTFVFVGLMIVGLGLMDAVICILAAKIKKPWFIAFFILSFVCSLCMGYLSSQNFAEAAMNWIAEGVNVVGQGALLVGAVLLHKNGLSEFKLRNGETA